MTILLTLLAFVVSLFLAIVGILLVNMFRGGGINMAAAYRHVALPIATVALVVAFAAAVISEVRHLRRLRAQTTTYRRAA